MAGRGARGWEVRGGSGGRQGRSGQRGPWGRHGRRAGLRFASLRFDVRSWPAAEARSPQEPRYRRWPMARARSKEKLTAAEARRIVLAAQGLAGSRPARPGPSALRKMFERVQVVQLDSVNVLARAHELLLWGRARPPQRGRAGGGGGRPAR